MRARVSNAYARRRPGPPAGAAGPSVETATRRRPAFRCAHLAPLVARVVDDAVAHALIGDRARAVRATIVLDEVAGLPSPGLARIARVGAAAVRAALGHAPTAVDLKSAA